MSVWVVRAGPNGESVNDSLNSEYSFIGWGEINRFIHEETMLEIRALVHIENPNRHPGVLTRDANQIFNFIHEIQVGDTCIMPIRRKFFAIGNFTGNYQFQDNDCLYLRHKRPVDWLSKSIPRSMVPKHILNRLKDRRTVFRIKIDEKENAELSNHEFIEWLTPLLVKPKE